MKQDDFFENDDTGIDPIEQESIPSGSVFDSEINPFDPEDNIERDGFLKLCLECSKPDFPVFMETIEATKRDILADETQDNDFLFTWAICNKCGHLLFIK